MRLAPVVASVARPAGASPVRDALALAVVIAVILLIGVGASHMVGSLASFQASSITLSPSALPYYALRTTLRMFAAMAVSLVFTFTYATLAAKSRRAGMVLIPLLDVLQSVPILGYLSFTVVFFVSLFPHSALGPELAAVFAIFTSQAWNMAFSFYQSLRTVPLDLDEASRSYRFSGWQRFWRVEAPFAMPGLIWNMMMSMSGGWFFVVAAEAISVGARQYALPGVGSYVALAIARRDLGAVGWAILIMSLTIAAYDQLLFRPLVAWADKFRSGQTSAQVAPHSVILDLFARSRLTTLALRPVSGLFSIVTRSDVRPPAAPAVVRRLEPPPRLIDGIWLALVAVVVGYLCWTLYRFVAPALTWRDGLEAAGDGLITLVRVLVLITLASLVWVPIGVAVGLNPALTEKVQPVAQFLAAFPANLMFPIAVVSIVHFHLQPNIWLSPLMILGTQWYIVFNVIAGASAFPIDLREAASIFHIRGWRWWRDVILPGILPYYVTGAITASGGAWNASIVSEAVSWGSTRLTSAGLGAYIARMTDAGDFPRIALGIAIMSILVVAMNRILWRPLYAFAEKRTRLE